MTVTVTPGVKVQLTLGVKVQLGTFKATIIKIDTKAIQVIITVGRQGHHIKTIGDKVHSLVTRVMQVNQAMTQTGTTEIDTAETAETGVVGNETMIRGSEATNLDNTITKTINIIGLQIEPEL